MTPIVGMSPPSRSRRSAAPVLILVALAATLPAGCARMDVAKGQTPPATDGPVRIGDNPGQICLPASKTGSLTMGFDVVRSTSSEPVTVTGVTLQGSRGIKVTESYLMPLRQLNLIGVLSTWPPDTTDSTKSDWERRVTAVGAGRLRRVPGVRNWNLVLKLTTDPAVATPRYKRLALRYTSRGKRYLAWNGTGLVVKRPC